MSGFRMVDLGSVFEWCPVFECFTSLDRFIYINFFLFICIKQSRLVNHSKTGHFSPVFEWFTSLDRFMYIKTFIPMYKTV